MNKRKTITLSAASKILNKPIDFITFSDLRSIFKGMSGVTFATFELGNCASQSRTKRKPSLAKVANRRAYHCHE